MLKMDGIEVMQRICADHRMRHQPVVVLASSKEDIDRMESNQLGANRYIRKPAQVAELVEAVKQPTLYRWL